MSTLEERQREIAPVLQELGSLLWICQLTEKGLAMLVVVLLDHYRSLGDKRVEEIDRLARMVEEHSAYEEKTFGPLARLVGELFPDGDLVARLKEAKDIRNRIAHTYMIEISDRLLDPVGRVRIVEDLRAMNEKVSTVSAMVRGLQDLLVEKFGIGHELRAEVRENVETKWSSLNPDAQKTPKH